jgi:hypothetical protein
MKKNIERVTKNYKLVLLKDGSLTFSKLFGYKKLYKFESVNNLSNLVTKGKIK